MYKKMLAGLDLYPKSSNKWIQNIKKLVEEESRPIGSKSHSIHTAHSSIKIFSPDGSFLYEIDPITRKKLRKNASLKSRTTINHYSTMDWVEESPIIGVDDNLWTRLEAEAVIVGVDFKD